MERGIKLTPRGQQIAELVALGLSNKQIAQRIFLSERTVEWHVEQVLNRLGFSSRSEIAAWVGRTQSSAAVHVPGRKRKGNLPAPLTSFVGRDRETAALRGLLASNRLLTIVGPGGTGKTRLALKLAGELEPAYPDGAWLCDLAPVADAALVADAVAQALGIAREAPDRLAAAREHLSERMAFLVLDNCEHVLTAASAIAADLLSACRDVRVMATSLAPLGIIGEAVWSLEPLPKEEAVRLFVDRAHASAPSFVLDDTSRTAVEAICDRLDRLPLALELAAPRLRVLTASELADRVTGATAARSGDRHGSLAALAAWGYETLEENERGMFRRLGVFAGWFEHDDAAAVAVDSAQMTTLLDSLVEKSMVVAGRTSEGRARYRLLETLRTFARRRLNEAGESEATRLAHAERMITITELLGLKTTGSDPWTWPKAEGMADDIRAALGALIELSPRRAAWLAGTLRWFWRGTGRLVEGVRWNEMVLKACSDACRERCWALHGHVILLLRIGRLDEARRCFREATALAEMSGSAEMHGELLLAQAVVYAALDDSIASEAADRQAFAELTKNGQVDRAAWALNDLANLLLPQGRVAEAYEMASRCVESLRQVRSGRIYVALDTLAQTDCFLGKLDDARALWLEAVPLSLESNEINTAAVCLEGLAYVAGVRRRTPAAVRLRSCADHTLSEAGDSYVGEPLEPKIKELIAQLESEVGPELAARLRAEGEALTLEEAIHLAEVEG